MSFSVDLVNLILYCAQQLGVVLGVGAQTVILIVYFLSMRDGKVEPKEEQFGRAVHRVLRWGLWLMVGSGFLITATHIFFGQLDIIFAPAFILKWLLIAAVWGMEVARRKQAFVHFAWEGVAGANWYALFALHVLAPVATWVDLLVLYVVWTAGFMACFVACVHTMRARIAPVAEKFSAPKKFVPPPSIPKPVPPPPKPTPPPPAVIQPAPIVVPTVVAKPVAPAPPPPVPHKPVVAIPPMPHKPQNQMLIPTKPSTAKHSTEHPGLPAIRVMPKTPADMDRQNRASVVQFSEA